jgi:rhodanese-related sulfurtransferase
LGWLLAGLAVLGLLLAGACRAASDEIDVAEAARQREAGAFLLDVRQPEEYREVHIPGVVLIPLGELEKRLPEVPKDKAIVVVCRSGSRSRTGRDILKRAGYPNVTSLRGGMGAWSTAGQPTGSGEYAKPSAGGRE